MMQKFLLLFVAVVALVFVGSSLTPASAQASRTWVSGTGNDSNPCSRTQPCLTFSAALAATVAGGEINCLDPGGFGTVTITKSISIICETSTAGVLASGTSGIIVNVATLADKVVLQGLDIDGQGTGLNGINIIGSGTTTIVKCSIRNFTQNGINLVGTSSAGAVIVDSLIINNAGGLNVQATSGINVAFLQNSFLSKNTNFATQITGPSTLVLIGSTLIGSPSGIIATGGASIISYGNNVLRNAGAPTQTLPLQ